MPDRSDFPCWSVEVLLKGSGAVVGTSYPIRWMRKDDEANEVVEYAFRKPREIPSSLPVPIASLEQDVRLTVTASESRVPEVVQEALAQIVSCLSFLSARSIEWSIGPITRVGLGSETDASSQKLLVPKKGGVLASPHYVSNESLVRALEALGDLQSKKAQRIMRAMRWLRRSRLESDDIDTFVDLAIALESLTSELHRLPSVAEALKDEAEPSSSAVLKTFALSLPQITEEVWKRVGRSRHKLFHGGFPDDDQTRAGLSGAIPSLRLAVIEGIRAALGLPPDSLPQNPLDQLGIGGISVTFTPTE